ncbi:hypothetical protein CP97_14825 [Aurantiacibacter atlanticus]|uniref:Uncharacterized protein n=1 Tax=Aurantiacibacter atlanticus TaxID=1648404 RepID=A0A161I4A7_9SPHN|nr:hypothetical protein [Aurantiacibacter atlanticus]ANC50511.1 hypothetical protein CP97_14825 [Aurantiacibacter atlanticus]MDF1835033.1 hypothetical protein [Alteraurantiacibacter sp. bin_em_oilr2.035]
MGFDSPAYGNIVTSLGYPQINDKKDFPRMLAVYLCELMPVPFERVPAQASRRRCVRR